MMPRVGPKDFLRVLNNPNPENTSEWFLRGRIMTYFKLEEIKASLFFENVLKEIICQIDENERKSKEFFENSIYNDLHNPQSNLKFSSFLMPKTRRVSSHRFIKKNFSSEDFIDQYYVETPKRGSLFSNASQMVFGKPVFEEEHQFSNPFDLKNRSDFSSEGESSSNQDFYNLMVDKSAQLHTKKQKKEILKTLSKKFV